MNKKISAPLFKKDSSSVRSCLSSKSKSTWAKSHCSISDSCTILTTENINGDKTSIASSRNTHINTNNISIENHSRKNSDTQLQTSIKCDSESSDSEFGDDNSEIENPQDTNDTVGTQDDDCGIDFQLVRKIAQLEVSNIESCKTFDELVLEAKESLATNSEFSLNNRQKRMNLATSDNIEMPEKQDGDIFIRLQEFSYLFHSILNIKKSQEIELKNLKQTKDSWENQNDEMVKRLGDQIIKLNSEVSRQINENMEMKFKCEYTIKKLQEEAVESQSQLLKCLHEKDQLLHTVQHHEHELLQVPRLEEKYHAAARDLVRQKEIAINKQELRWKAQEEEVKCLGYWKGRSLALDETVSEQNETIENLQRENRRFHSQSLRYHSLMKAQNQDDNIQSSVLISNRNNSSKSKGQTIEEVENNPDRGGGGGAIPETTNTSGIVLSQFEFESQQKLITKLNQQYQQEIEERERPADLATREKRAQREIIKLMHKNSDLEEKMSTLASRLSFARAHPLRSIDKTKVKVKANEFAATKGTGASASAIDEQSMENSFKKPVAVMEGEFRGFDSDSVFSATRSETEERLQRVNEIHQTYVKRVRSLKLPSSQIHNFASFGRTTNPTTTL